MGRRGWILIGVMGGTGVACLVVACVLLVTLLVWQGGLPEGEQAGRAATQTPAPDGTGKQIGSAPTPSEAPAQTSGTAEPTAPPDAAPTKAPVGPLPRPTPHADDQPGRTLSAIEAATLPVNDLFEVGIALGQLPADTPRLASETNPGFSVGASETFQIAELFEEGEEYQIEATLQAQTAHASWWVADGMGFDAAALDEAALVFEEEIYPTNHALFGEEWSPGIDGDPRIHLFLGNVPGVSGSYGSGDEFTQDVYSYSNEKEVIYLNLNDMEIGESYFYGVVAHEFQHMIQWNQDQNEEVWLNEGLSELAAHLNGFDVGGGPTAFARTTDIPVTQWGEQTSPFYGSSFLFCNYFYGRFGEEALHALVQSPLDGARSFDEVLAPQGLTFDQLFADWSVATLLDTPDLEGGRYEYPNDSAPILRVATTVTDFPEEAETEVNQYGIDYVRLDGEGENGTLEIEFSGDPTATLVPTEPHGGAWMLWGHRAADAHTFTTRRFDLTGLDAATLRFWTWYDLEGDYDFASIAVSTDGGVRWQELEAEERSGDTPSDRSDGAWTGKSGQPLDAGEKARAGWVEQEVDLSAWAGGEILVGFHTTSDGSIIHPGFLLDDISLPELDYSEDFETDSGGWEHQGFARVGNLLPQRYLVQAVLQGDNGPQVLPLALDAGNRATLTVPGFGTDIERVTLVVSGATPYTTARAAYRYEVRLEP